MRRATFFLLLLCFFLSGVAGLAYQVAWTKALGLVFGHTVYAITTVLAAFMGGLAAGSAVLGRWGERHSHPIALYAWIELLIGATGALSLVGLNAVRSLYLLAYHAAPDSTPFLVALRFLASILVLFIPTFLMGGTLPILTAGVTRSSAELGTRLGRLYWINTAGALVGALAAGFLLLPGIGLRLTVLFAVVLNMIAGCLALTVKGLPVQLPAVEEKERPERVASEIPWFLLISFAFVGATAMIYEVAWSRLLVTTLGSSTYAFTVMLATFLAGIALGGQLFEIWVSRRHPVSMATFCTTQTLTGLAAVIFLVIFQKLPAILWTLVTATHQTFGGLVLAQFATSALAMLPAAIIFGFNFPVVTLLIAKYRKQDDPSSDAVGKACAANTFGAILGAVAAGFWLVPRLGSFRLVAITAAANLSLAVFLHARQVPRRSILLAGNAVLASIVAVTGWSGVLNNPAVANFGVITNRASYPSTLRVNEAANTTDLLFAEDGLNASISVARASNYLGLRTNGKVDASTSDKITQLMVGHLGLLFHRAPKKVLIIGFGSGMTVSAVARYPGVERIDCVEIEPAVIHAARYLQPLNRGVLHDPRLHLIMDDARNFLFTTRNQYDVIISEPSNPWIAGVSALFTDEFYKQVRTHLAPGGILVQWVQAYSIFPEDLKMVFGTLDRHFPQVTAWRGEWADVVLLAQSKSGSLSLDRLRKLWSNPALQEDYEALGFRRPEGIIAYHLLDDPNLRKLAANARHNTDDLTRLEFRTPLAIFAENAGSDNVEMLANQRSHLLPAAVPIVDKRRALIGAAETLAYLGDTNREGDFLSALENYPPSADIELLRAAWLAALNRPWDARTAYENALRLDPRSLNALGGMADMTLAQNDYATTESLLRQILKGHPQYVPALEDYALLEQRRKHWAQAVNWQIKRIAADSDCPSDALSVLARLFLESGDLPGAESVYTELLGRDPYDADAHRKLGEIFHRESRWDKARVQLEFVVRYYPAWDPRVYVSLANVYRNLDRWQDAKLILRKGERIFPGNYDLARAATLE